MFRTALSSTFFYLLSDVYRVFIFFRPFLSSNTFDITARLFFWSKILPRYVNCVDSKVTRILLKKNRRITKAVVSSWFQPSLLITIRLFTTLSSESSFSRLVQCKVPPRCLSKIFFPFSAFDNVHRISFLSALAPSRRHVQYVSCAYARKFKYLLFVIKFGGASRMGILHRDCAMQRDRPSLFVRGNGDLHIDRYFILLLSRTSPPDIHALASPRFVFSIFRFRSVPDPAGVSPVPVSRWETFSFYPLHLLTLTP